MTLRVLLACVLPVVALSDELRRVHVRMLRAALRGADLTLDAAAQEAERDLSQFRRQLEGLEGSLPSFWKQPRAFWQWYGVAIATTFGVPKELRRGAQLRRVAVTRRRMVRMALAGRKERAS